MREWHGERGVVCVSKSGKGLICHEGVVSEDHGQCAARGGRGARGHEGLGFPQPWALGGFPPFRLVDKLTAILAEW